MQIDIQSYGISLNDTLRDYAQRRLLFAMAYCSGHINRVVISLSNVNNPHGGANKRCHILVILTGIPDVMVEDTQINLYAAIDRAIDRAKRTVVRKVDQELTLHNKLTRLH